MDHGGMQMGDNSFSARNKALARDFWYIVAGVLALLLLVRLVNYGHYWLRFVRVHSQHPLARRANDTVCSSQAADQPSQVGAIPHETDNLVLADMGHPHGRVPRGQLPPGVRIAPVAVVDDAAAHGPGAAPPGLLGRHRLHDDG